MNKDVQMVFRVEPDLRASFNQAAESQHRPAAQVLRDFMRFYVNQTKELSLPSAERLRRQEAFDDAKASVGLEGFKAPAAYEVEAQRFIKGEIDFADLTQVVHEQARKR